MTRTMDFTDTEWQTLQFAPLWTFTLIAGVDGKIEPKEMQAFATEMGDAAAYKSPLVRNVLMSVATDFAAVMHAFGSDRRMIDAGLREVAELLDHKVDHTEALMFKGAIVMLAVKVARAGESRFRHKVSDQSKAAVAIVGRLLQFEPDEFTQVAGSYQRH